MEVDYVFHCIYWGHTICICQFCTENVSVSEKKKRFINGIEMMEASHHWIILIPHRKM